MLQSERACGRRLSVRCRQIAGREVDAGREKLEMLKNIQEEGRSRSRRMAIVSRDRR